MSRISIRGMDKATVLAALFNASKPQGLGFMHYAKEPMTVEKARELIDKGHTKFDYLQGRVMKLDISGDDFDPWGYDHDNGQGAAQTAIDTLKASGDVNNSVIQSTHDANTKVSAMATRARLDEETKFGPGYAEIGMADMKDKVSPKIDKVLGGKVE